MDQILLDKQPGLATSAIVGTLTLAKTGTTARTATFPDAAITVAGLEVANTFTTAQTIVSANGLTTRPAATQDAVRIQGRATGTNSYILTLTTVGALSASGTVYLPTVDGSTMLATTSTPVAGHIPFSAGTNYAATLSTDLNFDVGTQTLRVGTISGSINTVILATAGTGGAGTARLRLGTNVREWEIKAGASPYALSIDYVGTDAPLANVLSFTKAGLATFIGAVTVPNGTAAAPGIRTTTYAHGMHSIGATSVGIDVAGALVLTVGSAASSFASGTTLTVANTTASTTTATGALVVSGGVGIGGAIYGGSILNLPASAATTVAGNLQRETNQDTHYTYTNGIGGWVDKCIFSQYATVTQSGIVTAQSLASATARGTRTLPANFFKLGKVLKFRLCGHYTTDAAAGNATISINLGGTTFRTTGSFALDNSVTAGYWVLEGEVVCQSTGVSGTVAGQVAWVHAQTSPPAESQLYEMPMTTTGAVTVDTTASAAFDVVWTATDAGTSITCTCFRLWEVC